MRRDKLSDSSAREVLLTRVAPDVVDSLTPEQRLALADALRDVRWKRHPIDVRLSVPFIGRRFYFTMIAGEEKRNAARRRMERELRPVGTMGNLVFVLGIAALFYVMAILGIFFYSEVLEY
ncbi:MAG: hypothetical protein H7840_00795 [Alphaproteobacteria bacterium]